jgi:hypothetical protein
MNKAAHPLVSLIWLLVTLPFFCGLAAWSMVFAVSGARKLHDVISCGSPTVAAPAAGETVSVLVESQGKK